MNTSEETFSVFLDNVDCIPELSDDQKGLCEGSLSNAECFNALKYFPNGKSPGNDGLISEVYKKFWPLLGQLLTDSLNYSLMCGELSISQKQAVIRLVEKKHRDKISSKALASRLIKVLPQIIGEDQYA